MFGGSDDAAAAERARLALLLATRTLGVSAAEVRQAKRERDAAVATRDFFVASNGSDVRRGSGDAGVDDAGGAGDATATSVRHALLLARRALAINAEAARTAREERDAAREELRAAAERAIDGRSWPLWGAGTLGRAARIGMMLEEAFDMDDECEQGYTHIVIAAQWGFADYLRLLIEAGADVDAGVEEDGCTPMHGAIEFGNAHCLRLLLEAGADMEKADFYGDTPMQSAARHGRADCVRLLLEAGADASARNADGRTALQLAERNAHEAAAALLRRAHSSG